MWFYSKSFTVKQREAKGEDGDNENIENPTEEKNSKTTCEKEQRKKLKSETSHQFLIVAAVVIKERQIKANRKK